MCIWITVKRFAEIAKSGYLCSGLLHYHLPGTLDGSGFLKDAYITLFTLYAVTALLGKVKLMASGCRLHKSAKLAWIRWYRSGSRCLRATLRQ